MESEYPEFHRYRVVPQSTRKKMKQHPLCRNLFVAEIGFQANTSFQPVKKITPKRERMCWYMWLREPVGILSKRRPFACQRTIFSFYPPHSRQFRVRQKTIRGASTGRIFQALRRQLLPDT